jgi:hypothetical protein
MGKRPTALAELDIEREGLAHQDGLAERLARQRAKREGEPTSVADTPPHSAVPQVGPSSGGAPDKNAWRRGKSLIQVAIPEDLHVELGVIAKRRRITLSQMVKAALNDWLDKHDHRIRIPD